MDSTISIDDILNGVTNQEFELRFSPQLNLATGNICGLESNLIWVNERYDNLTKTHILSILSRHNKRVSFFLYYLVQGLQAQRHFSDIGTPLQISLSLRPSELSSPKFFQAVDRVFRDCGASANRITLEFPPAVLDHVYDHMAIIGRLIDYGFRISIRDFYQDPCSLSKISRELISEIKTPAALGSKIIDSPNAQRNLQKLIDDSRENNWNCVVQGVDSRRCLQQLKAIGATTVQGSYMGDNLDLYASTELLQALPRQESELCSSWVQARHPTA